MKHPNSFTPAEVWQTNKTEVIASAIIAIAAIIDFCYGNWLLGVVTLLLAAGLVLMAMQGCIIDKLKAIAEDYANELDKCSEAQDLAVELTEDGKRKDAKIIKLSQRVKQLEYKLKNKNTDITNLKLDYKQLAKDFEQYKQSHHVTTETDN
jgi:predicted nuclease with TOPRIM domain